MLPNVKMTRFLANTPDRMIVVSGILDELIDGPVQMYVAGFINALEAEYEPLPTFDALELRALRWPKMLFFLEPRRYAEFNLHVLNGGGDSHAAAR